MNIAGFNFGCQINVSLKLSRTLNNTSANNMQGTCLLSLGGGDGAGQMHHFMSDDQMNIFRLRKIPTLSPSSFSSLIQPSRLLAIPRQQSTRRTPRHHQLQRI